MENKDYLILKFSGINKIDINEFAAFLKAMSKYINGTKKDIDDDIDLKTNVVAIQKGSFLVNIEPVIGFIGSTIPLIPPIVTNTKEIVSILKEVIEVKDFLKGKKMENLTANTVTNYNGDVYNISGSVYKIYNNGESKSLEALDAMVKKIPNDRDLEVYSTFDDKKIVINNENKENFLLTKGNIIDEESYLTNNIKVKVIVKKPSLDMGAKWTVFYDKSINVNIIDKEFSRLVKNGEISFKNGSELTVDLEIKAPITEKEHDKNDNKNIYTITKVYLDESTQKKQLKFNE